MTWTDGDGVTHATFRIPAATRAVMQTAITNAQRAYEDSRRLAEVTGVEGLVACVPPLEGLEMPEHVCYCLHAGLTCVFPQALDRETRAVTCMTCVALDDPQGKDSR